MITPPDLDTSNTTEASGLFSRCSNLTALPQYDLNKVNDVNNMFDGCVNVSSGALDLYNQLSTRTNPPNEHSHTFRDCGINTQTGSAELAKIPSDWK